MSTESKPAAGGQGWHNVLLRSREGSLVLLIAFMTVLTTSLNPRFISPQSLKDLMLNVSIIALLVLGQTVIILMRQIDLSISSIVGITAFLSGILFINHPGIPSILVVLIAVVAGLLLGGINAALIAWGRIPALITTLGTLYIFRGANYAWVHGRQVNAVNVPGSFLAIGTSTLVGIPILTWIVLILLVVFAIGLRQYRIGREFYAIGSNPNAAVLAGINVSQRLATGFLISGAIAGLAGALWLARFGTVDATAAEGIELSVITSTVVGGVAITGGVGTVVGAVLGALLLSVFSSTLVFLRVPSFWQQAFQGAMLLLAIAADAYLAHRYALRLRVKWSHV
ncbi:MAG: ABC transporter permease [Verrucomicrobia bacterium]|nr:ABC transporter permease [Verrucomicrobiota bacterium]MBV8376288.1 ABC transporter permease [Verrucomicrobiota bacterium]